MLDDANDDPSIKLAKLCAQVAFAGCGTCDQEGG
jgi:hypothetical protein